MKRFFDIITLESMEVFLLNKKYGWLFLFLVGADQLSKYLIELNLNYNESIEIIKGFFSLHYVRNEGAAWSMMEGKMIFFYLISIVALIAMVYFFKSSEKKDKFTRLGLVMMMAGTIGNLYDRLVFKYVRDFLDFNIFGYDFPVFNIADMALCIGVGFIILDVFLESRGLQR